MTADEFEILDNVVELQRDLRKAKDLLMLTYNCLCHMTTENFRRGADKAIRDRIAEFLEIDDE